MATSGADGGPHPIAPPLKARVAVAVDLLDAGTSPGAVYAAFEEELFEGEARVGENVFIDA